jgi:ABC-type bacteriocin/lantibiotic exporter with double-glycine peptidase domain
MLNWYAQEQPTSCVAACVRMVLTGFGVVWTEGQVRTIFGRPRLGITLTAAQAHLVHAGARAVLHEDWSLDGLLAT